MKDNLLISVAKGELPADLVLANARVVNVFTGEIEPGNVAICRGRIAGVGDYHQAKICHMPAWTIVTNMFVHAGIWHILANMITLYFFGSYLIRLVGERNFFIIYFLGGIIGNIFYSFIFTPPLITVTTSGIMLGITVGASGAVFAVAGALTVMRPRLRVFIIPIPVPLPLWVAVIGGCLIISFFPYVAWQAHLGGLVFGLAFGYFFGRQRRFY